MRPVHAVALGAGHACDHLAASYGNQLSCVWSNASPTFRYVDVRVPLGTGL